MSVLGPEEIDAFVQEQRSGRVNDWFKIEAAGNRAARVRMLYDSQQLRPGGIISGPSLMMLADFALWVAVLAEIGREPMSVTVNLNINFLKRAMPGDVIAETRLHKVGKRLATGDVLLYSDGDDEPVAQASVTYSIPQHEDGSEPGSHAANILTGSMRAYGAPDPQSDQSGYVATRYALKASCSGAWGSISWAVPWTTTASSSPRRRVALTCGRARRWRNRTDSGEDPK